MTEGLNGGEPDRRPSIPIRPSWRRLVLLSAPVLLAVTLAGCRLERPAPVSFPDDPRVLDGTWILEVTGFDANLQRAVLDATGTRLLIASPDHAWLYVRVGDRWSEADAEPYRPFRTSVFDPSLDSLVAFRRVGTSLTATLLAMGDASTRQVEVTLPAADPELVTAGSGRILAVFLEPNGARVVHWWSLETGEPGGSVSVPRVADSMKRSANGRFLSFWDVRASRVHLLDTDEPASLRTLGLGVCTSDGTAEGSDDGRWFLGGNCLDELRVLDLSQDRPTWRPIGAKASPSARFARGTSSVVWQDALGNVRSLDLLGGATTTLAELEAPDTCCLDRLLNVEPGSGLLTAPADDGLVHVVTLGGGAETLLPALDFAGATLELTAGQPSDYGTYGFTGTLLLDAEGAMALLLDGYVNADRFHDYQLGPAALPPPALRGSASVAQEGAPENADPLYTLDFSTDDRHATTYEGTLQDHTSGFYYAVSLRDMDE